MLCSLTLILKLRLLLQVLLAPQALVTPMPRLLAVPAPPTGPMAPPFRRRPLLVAMALRALWARPRRLLTLLLRALPRRLLATLSWAMPGRLLRRLRISPRRLRRTRGLQLLPVARHTACRRRTMIG